MKLDWLKEIVGDGYTEDNWLLMAAVVDNVKYTGYSHSRYLK